jgi:hypothetical protein
MTTTAACLMATQTMTSWTRFWPKAHGLTLCPRRHCHHERQMPTMILSPTRWKPWRTWMIYGDGIDRAVSLTHNFCSITYSSGSRYRVNGSRDNAVVCRRRRAPPGTVQHRHRLPMRMGQDEPALNWHEDNYVKPSKHVPKAIVWRVQHLASD